MASKKTSGSSQGVQETSGIQGNGITVPPTLTAIAAAIEAVEQEPEAGEGGNGHKPPPPPADAAAEEPRRKSPFEALESENGLGKRESIFRNLEALKIPADEDEDDTSEEVLSMIPVRRPGKRAFRAQPDDKYQLEAFIIENSKEKVVKYVVPKLGKALADKDAIESLKRVILVLCIGKSGKMFFWPIPAKGQFRDSGLRAVDLARRGWIKAVGNLDLGGYQIFKMRDEDYGEPAWPEVMPELEELLELAFSTDIIDKEEHPELKAAKNV